MLATVLGMNPKNIKCTNHDTSLTNLTFDSNFTSVVVCTHSSATLVAELPNGGEGGGGGLDTSWDNSPSISG